MYRQADTRIIKALCQIVGSDSVLAGADETEPYGHDEVSGLRAEPEVPARVKSTKQAVQVLRLAQRERR